MSPDTKFNILDLISFINNKHKISDIEFTSLYRKKVFLVIHCLYSDLRTFTSQNEFVCLKTGKKRMYAKEALQILKEITGDTILAEYLLSDLSKYKVSDIIIAICCTVCSDMSDLRMIMDALFTLSDDYRPDINLKKIKIPSLPMSIRISTVKEAVSCSSSEEFCSLLYEYGLKRRTAIRSLRSKNNGEFCK